MSFNSLDELAKNVVFSFFTLDNIGVLVSVVSCLNFVHVKHSISIFVNFLEGLSDQISSLRAKRSSDSIEELLDTQGTIVVGIEHVEQDRNVFLTNTDSEIAASLGKFCLRESLTLVIVHHVENSLQTDDATGTSSLDFVSKESH